jgi:hypothetical protein
MTAERLCKNLQISRLASALIDGDTAKARKILDTGTATVNNAIQECNEKHCFNIPPVQ